MKFGIMMHKNTQNIGDDIQAYAAARLLPSVDYFLDRESLDSFVTDDGEPAAVVMSAWYMWHKWNWPPSKYIVPLFTGIHYTDNERAKQDGSPVTTEFLTGLSRDYLNACGGVGCRDMFTKRMFDELGIDCYFSGCITLTLPEQPRVKPEREYVVTVDIGDPSTEHIKKLLEGTGIEHRDFKHYKDYRGSIATWEERVAYVEEVLGLYQNAKCVVTRRLHCALPCLAMGVPVLLLNNEKNGIRFEPYYSWLHYSRREDFISGKFRYDVTDPPPNKPDYLPYREAMIKQVRDFAEKYKDVHGTPAELCPLDYDEDELIRWRHDAMRRAMDNWFDKTREDIHKIRDLGKDKKKLENNVADLKEQIRVLKEQKKQVEQERAEARTALSAAEKENKRLRNVLSCRPVKFTIAARNAFMPEKKKIKV